MMGMYWAIYAGFILGILARALLGHNRSGTIGFVVPALVGMAGAFVLDYAGLLAGLYGPDQLGGFLAGIVGAMLVLACWRTFDRSRAAA